MAAALVSIIIPFYNEERYLERAVRSALGQTYPALEIILSDDGSDDGAASIAVQLAQQYEQVRLIRSEHHSIGRARNNGVAVASGKYIAYLDSDDELEADAIEQLVQTMESTAVDMVVGGFGMYTPDGTPFKLIENGHLPALTTAQAAELSLCREQIARVVWGKLFKAALCRQIAFPEGIWFEDGPYLMAYFCRCREQVAISNVRTVKHYCRPDSVTRQHVSAKRISDTFHAFETEFSIVQEQGQARQVTAQLFSYYQRALMNNLVMLAMDRQQVPLAIREVYLQTFAAFVQRKNKERVHLGPRTKLNLLLMHCPAWMGWPLFFRVFPVLKPGLFHKIAAIRALGSH